MRSSGQLFMLPSRNDVDTGNVSQPYAEDDASSSFREEENSSPAPLYPPNRVFSREQLEVLNLLVHPVWVFDIDCKCMKWANEAAVELWNANSLSDLLDRNFSDMSEATATRLATYGGLFELGQRVYDQWTFYPKGEAKTVRVVGSGVRLSVHEQNPSMLIEATPTLNEELQPQMLRGVEMLRHLPVPVCQFNMNGKMMFQNPVATLKRQEEQSGSGSNDDSTSSSATSSVDPTDFLPRFMDPKVGRNLLQKMQSSSAPGHIEKLHDNTKALPVEIETEVMTRKGPRWSAVQLRRTSDPVTGESVILYSSRDMTDALRAKRAREDSIAKSEFLAIMAHEIRTPLHQVTGFIDLLDQTELDKEQRSFVRLLKSSAQGLMTVINDVLDYSKLEAGKMKLESIPYEPRSVLEGSMGAVRTSCEDKNIYLEMKWNKNIPFRVMGDPNRLRQILLNLLSNAVKFTKQGGITVEVLPEILSSSDPIGQRGHAMIKFVVSDTGMGISEEHKNVIFHKYQQASVAVTRNFGGTGLGLSICELLVQNMGGSIGLESEYGKGSTFWFTLPAKVPNALDFAPQDLDLSYHVKGTLRILVAEDNMVNQKLVSNMLKRMGHTSDLAANGEIAIEMLEQNDYDAVLMDIQMPIMDGLEATRRIRTMGYTTLPILGLTASASRSDFTELGFNDWLPKPIPMLELKAKLYRILCQREGQSPLSEIRETL